MLRSCPGAGDGQIVNSDRFFSPKVPPSGFVCAQRGSKWLCCCLDWLGASFLAGWVRQESFWSVDKLDQPRFFAALKQTPLNCEGTNDAKATWQRRPGSSRSEQLRNSICIFGGVNKVSTAPTATRKTVSLVAFDVGDLCLHGRTRCHQTTSVVARSILVCISGGPP